MKTSRILQAAVVLALATLVVSCGSSRDYSSRRYPPRTQANFSLILSSGPGMVVTRHPRGGYYYRDPFGRIYWRGYGNRYYIDRRYVTRNYYGHNQYGDWRRYHNYRRGRR